MTRPSSNKDLMMLRTLRSHRRAVLSVVALTLLVLLVVDGELTGQVLQKAAGYDENGSVRFTGVEKFLDNLRGSIGPIAAPAAILGFSVGGLAMWIGKQWAQLVLTGTLLGALLVFLAPGIVQ